MDGSENTFPMDITDTSSRPWNFRPEGYLVVILAGTEEAERTEAALVESGFAPRDIKLYTDKQILGNHEEHMRRRGVTSKAVGSWPMTPRVGRSQSWKKIWDQGLVDPDRLLEEHEAVPPRGEGSRSWSER